MKSSVKLLSVVIPCYNEEENLDRFPEEVFDVLRPLAGGLEIVLVDDGSRDGTFKKMGELGKQYPFVKIFRHTKNLGLGAALRTGFSLCSGDAIVTLDSDLTFHPDDVEVLLEAYGQDVDCVIGSPFIGKMEDVHPVRHFMSWSVNRLYRLLLKRNLTSISGIFRIYRAAKLKKLRLVSTAFDINVEILVKLLLSGAGVVEVPVTLGRRIHGVSKINTPREILNHLKMFLRIGAWKIGSSI